jgi:hypothetical protein
VAEVAQDRRLLEEACKQMTTRSTVGALVVLTIYEAATRFLGAPTPSDRGRNPTRCPRKRLERILAPLRQLFPELLEPLLAL